MYIPTQRNPLTNDALNPLLNESINPLTNDALNPLLNESINPLMNDALNYLANDALNPHTNGAINPLVNEAVNPLNNGAYPGPLFFHIQGTFAGFGVAADGDILALFNELLTHAGTAVPVGDMLAIFDTGNRWVGYLLPNGAGGYARFDIAGQWVGYAH
ncbi:hypothetical protein HC891_14490 [Candidatus Gracilibacteria bacterium]|nr:hypothetical protein [Candidatus Gracilibacteria bacterium]